MSRSALVAFTLAVATLVAAQSTPTGTFLAVVRGNVLQPVARFDGQSWLPPGSAATWPRRWFAHGATGSGATPLIAATRQAGDRCSSSTTMVIESTRPASRVNDVTVAASASVTIGGAQAVMRDAPARSAAVAALSPLFARAARSNGVSQPVLARIPPVIDVMYMSEVATTAPYYVEASKRVPDAGNTPVEDPRGVVRVAITGWFHPDGQTLVPAATKAELQWEPADPHPASGPSLTPRAVLSEPARDLWVMEVATGNQKSYALYAVSRNSVRMLVSVDASAC